MFSRQSPRRKRRGENDGAARDARRPGILRLLSPVLLALMLALLVLVGTSRPVSAAPSASGSMVDVTLLNSEINASSQHFLTGAISTAERDGAQALVIEINTPGGAIDAM